MSDDLQIRLCERRRRIVYPDCRSSDIATANLRADALRAKVDEINRLAPDYLWVALGVPYEQALSRNSKPRLANVGVIKTSGGLFKLPLGSRARAAMVAKYGTRWPANLA